ncbi:MAG: mechanosensitive ion channel family protein [Chloroflexi bacterium]|nr:MAG: mechanosensitive ion channel family protein [Chloroflexota bacterium]
MSASLQSAILEYIIPIVGVYLLAYFVHRRSGFIARRLLPIGGFALRHRRPRPERQRTLYGLVSSAITIAAYMTATAVTIGRFVDATTVVWMIGLFTAGFGLGARPLLSDYLSGISFIFEDTFDVGEKVEIMGIQGLIEEVNLRMTLLRGEDGELYTIPNGEIRIVRNFSRGRYSVTNAIFKIPTRDLNRSLTLLDELGKEACTLLPNLIEPWQVLAEDNVGQHTELKVLAKAQFGKGAELRPRMVSLIHERLSEAEIELAD